MAAARPALRVDMIGRQIRERLMHVDTVNLDRAGRHLMRRQIVRGRADDATVEKMAEWVIIYFEPMLLSHLNLF